MGCADTTVLISNDDEWGTKQSKGVNHSRSRLLAGEQLPQGVPPGQFVTSELQLLLRPEDIVDHCSLLHLGTDESDDGFMAGVGVTMLSTLADLSRSLQDPLKSLEAPDSERDLSQGPQGIQVLEACRTLGVGREELWN